MGATTFMTEASGKTAADAFNSAVRQAQYEYGHNPYSGTIGTKDSFILILDTPEQAAEMVRKAEDLNEEWRTRRAEEVLAKRSAHTIARALLDADDERITDKWGPAGCIEIEPGRYLFFGLAPE